jgi:hypothetical protein
MNLYYNLTVNFGISCVGYEVLALAGMEPPLKYHPCGFEVLT